jgi:hypothetical protein
VEWESETQNMKKSIKSKLRKMFFPRNKIERDVIKWLAKELQNFDDVNDESISLHIRDIFANPHVSCVVPHFLSTMKKASSYYSLNKGLISDYLYLFDTQPNSLKNWQNNDPLALKAHNQKILALWVFNKVKFDMFQGLINTSPHAR